MTFRFAVGPSRIDRIQVGLYANGELWATDWWTTLHEWRVTIAASRHD